MIVHSQSMAIGDLWDKMMAADGPTIGGQRVLPSLHRFVRRFCETCNEGCNITQIRKRVSLLWDADEPIETKVYLARCENYEEKG